MRNEADLSGGKRAVLPSSAEDALAGRAETQRHKDVFLVTAGVPCQDVSVAGKRAGLAAKRTGLFYEFARVLQEVRPAWFIFENVPGLLNSNHGRDFAEVLRVLMVECGYGVSWRVLDSQFFGVAQRRRRVFIVGCFGKPCPAEILFEPTGGERNPETSSEARPHIVAPLTSGSGLTGNAPGRRREDDENLAYCLREDPGGIGQGHNTTYAVTENMRNRSQGPANYVTGPLNTRNGHSINAEDAAGSHIVAAQISASAGHHGHSSPRGDGSDNLVSHALSVPTSNGRNDPNGEDFVVAMPITGHSGWRGEDRDTYIPLSGTLGTRNRSDEIDRNGGTFVGAPPDSDRMRDFAGLPEGLDSARYRALGNAVTVQVIEWIGRRIVEANDFRGMHDRSGR